MRSTPSINRDSGTGVVAQSCAEEALVRSVVSLTLNRLTETTEKPRYVYMYSSMGFHFFNSILLLHDVIKLPLFLRRRVVLGVMEVARKYISCFVPENASTTFSSSSLQQLVLIYNISVSSPTPEG